MIFRASHLASGLLDCLEQSQISSAHIDFTSNPLSTSPQLMYEGLALVLFQRAFTMRIGSLISYGHRAIDLPVRA